MNIVIEKKSNSIVVTHLVVLRVILFNFLDLKLKEIFKINIALYPKKSLVYDSMGDAFKKEKDTLKAIEFYKKSLAINPENNNSLKNLKRILK